MIQGTSGPHPVTSCVTGRVVIEAGWLWSLSSRSQTLSPPPPPPPAASLCEGTRLSGAGPSPSQAPLASELVSQGRLLGATRPESFVNTIGCEKTTCCFQQERSKPQDGPERALPQSFASGPLMVPLLLCLTGRAWGEKVPEQTTRTGRNTPPHQPTSDPALGGCPQAGETCSRDRRTQRRHSLLTRAVGRTVLAGTTCCLPRDLALHRPVTGHVLLSSVAPSTPLHASRGQF